MKKINDADLRAMKAKVEIIAKQTHSSSVAFNELTNLWAMFCEMLGDPPTTIVSGCFVENGQPVEPIAGFCGDGHRYESVVTFEKTADGVIDSTSAEPFRKGTFTRIQEITLFCTKCGGTKVLPRSQDAE